MKKVDTFNEIQKIIDENNMTLVFFSDDMWSNCVGFGPKLKKLLEKYPKIEAIEIDINNNIKAKGQYSIFVAPTVILFIEGKQAIKMSKFITVDELDSSINRYYKMIFS